MSNPHTYEQGVAMGVGMYYGAKGSGVMPKAQTPIKTMPAGAAKIKNLFPEIRNGYGIFGRNGVVVGFYRIDVMYQGGDALTGTYFSMKNLIPGRSLFRIDKGYLHKTSQIKVHSSIRFTIGSQTFGSSGQRNWYPSSIKPPFFKPLKKIEPK